MKISPTEIESVRAQLLLRWSRSLPEHGLSWEEWLSLAAAGELDDLGRQHRKHPGSHSRRAPIVSKEPQSHIPPYYPIVK